MGNKCKQCIEFKREVEYLEDRIKQLETSNDTKLNHIMGVVRKKADALAEVVKAMFQEVR